MASVITAGTTSTTALNLTGDTSGELQIKTNNGSTTAMTLTTAGNVGVGTTSPTNVSNYKFITLNATTGAVYQAYGASSTDARIFADNAYGGVGMFSNHPFLFYTNSTERMRIDSSGNLLVGRTTTTGTNCRLNVQLTGTSASGYTAASNAGISLDCGTATNGVINLVGGGDVGLFHSNSSGAYDVGIGLGSNASRIMTFTTASTERMRIDSAGNVFFKGTYVSFNDTGYIRCDVSNSLALQSGSSTSVGFQLRNAGNGATPMLSMNGLSGGSLALEGATPQTGIGITFPATQSASSDANTLDDYEEGTWTPTLGGNATYVQRSGGYTKIGNVVTARCTVQVNTLGTGSANTISGLPFTSTFRSQGSLAYFAALSQNVVFLSPFAEGSAINLVGTTTANTNVVDGISIFQNNAYVIIQVTYFTS